MDQASSTIEKALNEAEQCQAVLRTGQCSNKVVTGCNFCPSHGGAHHLKKQTEQALNNYRINKFQVRLKEMRSASTIKDLRDEIAILRMMLEEKLNGFESATDMLLQSGAIGDLIMKIEKLVLSCHKLDERMGTVIDRSVVITMAEQLVALVTKEMTNNPEGLERIAIAFERIMKETGALPNQDK